MKTFGERLKELRLDKKLSQEELAKFFKISLDYLAGLEDL